MRLGSLPVGPVDLRRVLRVGRYDEEDRCFRGGPQGILLVVSKGGKKAHRNSRGFLVLGGKQR